MEKDFVHPKVLDAIKLDMPVQSEILFRNQINVLWETVTLYKYCVMLNISSFWGDQPDTSAKKATLAVMISAV